MFVELVFFRSKPEVADADVLASANKILELATMMNSPFKLELLRTEEGEWVEIVHSGSIRKKRSVSNRLFCRCQKLRKRCR